MKASRLVVSILCCAASLYSYQEPPPSAQLVIRPAVEREVYCLGSIGIPGVFVWRAEPPEAITLKLRMRFEYRNVGSVPIILPWSRAESSLEIQRRTISARTYNDAVRLPYGSKRIASVREGATPTRDFEILPPGSAQYDSGIVELRVHGPKAERGMELLGQAVSLRVEMDHLLFPNSQAKRLSKRWKAQGHLWTEKIWTEPVVIEIPAKPTTVACSINPD